MLPLILILSLLGTSPPDRPVSHVVVILADDLGAGDPRFANAGSAIATPHMDRLAAAGMTFTDAHSPSAVCTPTRYGLLTGRYAWRTRLKSGVLWGSSPLLLDPDRTTLADVASRASLRTGCFGKWHLGLGEGESTNWDAPLRPGPRQLGFDRFFGIPASLDMPPYLFVEDESPRAPATGHVTTSAHRRQGGGGFWRAGAIAPDFLFDDVLPAVTRHAVGWIEERGRVDDPFLIYVPLTAPHTPWVPTAAFQGTSTAGYYGDFVAQVDHSIGQILAALDRLDLTDDTLVILTSDNGAHWPEADEDHWGHRANLDWRGQKADIHEGGHRVPFVVRWPGVVEPGTTSDALISLLDIVPTVASILEVPLSPDEAPDGVDLGPLLRGQDPAARECLVHHSLDGMFALRCGRWKLIEGLGSGGFTKPARRTPTDGGPQGQLYDLRLDPGERFNLWLERPAIVARLTARLDTIRAGN